MPTADALPPLFEEFPPTATEDWMDKIREDLGSSDPAAVLQWDTGEGIVAPAFGRREALPALSHVDLEADTPPLTATGDTASPNGWHVRQDLTHPDPATANRWARSALGRGVTDLGVVGRPSRPGDFGVDLSAPDAVSTLLADLSLNDVALHIEGPAAAPALFAAVLEQAHGSEGEPRGTIAYDPVAALVQGHASADDAFAWAEEFATSEQVPSRMRSLAVDARLYHDAGGTAVQELAFALGALSELCARLADRGVSPSTVADRLHTLTSVSTRYFVEIAKLRALRLLVPQVLNAFDDPLTFTPTDLFVQAKTSRRSETVYDPYVNMLRATTEAMAAVLGGCDTLSVRPYDASLRPTENFSARIARNTQLILTEESHFDAVADPAAGSYYIETLTDRLAQAAWEQFQALEADGGLLAALRDGTVQSALREKREARIQAVEDRTEVVVGTNHYPEADERRSDDLNAPADPETRSAPSISPAPSLDAIGEQLRDGHSVTDVAAARAPTAPSVEPLPRIRLTDGLEQLRLRTERYADAHDGPPTVLLVPIGPAALRSARATFARNFLGVAGFEMESPLRFETVAAAADAVAETSADLVVLCSADDEYADLTPALHHRLQDRGLSPLLIVAGNPAALPDDLPADLYIYRDCPLHDTLEDIQRRLGIREGSPGDG